MFVQPVKTALRAEPQMSATEVASLGRGDEVSVLENKGAWLKVEKSGKSGWLSKLFLNKNKPLGSASLADEVPASDAKTSRRRESSYAVSASTRGLMPVQRTREGLESYRSNFKALDSMERLAISDDELGRFLKEAKLNR